MSLTFAWAINSLKLKDETNHEGATLNRAVYQTHWTITGTNSAGQSGTWAGATPLSAANVPAGSFVAFDDLTEDTVVGWIRNIVENDEGYMAHITERLEMDIEKSSALQKKSKRNHYLGHHQQTLKQMQAQKILHRQTMAKNKVECHEFYLGNCEYGNEGSNQR